MSGTPESGTVRFTFDGRQIEARAGRSVAAALLDAGVSVLTRSSKYRRPRGVSCARGHCPNCMVRIDGMPDVRACMVPVKAGMQVETEGSTSRRVDIFRSIDGVGGKLFPVGFQYRWFKRQNVAWKVWESQLRRLAAETEMPAPTDVPEGRRLNADLLVVGAGPAGLAAADAAASAGLKVVLAGRRARLGGRAAGRIGGDGTGEELARIIERLRAAEKVEVLAPGTVVASFGDRYVIDCGDHAAEVKAPASVLATGAYERAVVFPGNDRPGVMLASGLRRMVIEEGALRNRAVAYVVSGEGDTTVASELLDAGMRIAAIVDLRPGPRTDLPPGVPVLSGARVSGVKGHGKVTGLAVELGGKSQTIPCDLVAMSGGWQRADELRFVATSEGDRIVVGERAAELGLDRPPEQGLAVLQGIGAVVGTGDAALAIAEGRAAGALATGIAGTTVEGALSELVAARGARSDG